MVYLTETRREGDVAAFVWDGSKLVPTDARTLAKRSEFVAILTLVLVQLLGPFWL